MSFTITLLMPLVLLLPAAGAVEAARDVSAPARKSCEDPNSNGAPDAVETVHVAPQAGAPTGFQRWQIDFVTHAFTPERAYQVRIERQMTIRIVPRSPVVRPDAFVGVPSQPIGPRFKERKIGHCLPVSRISGVQANGDDDLLLFLNDRRIVRAELERSCSARDFYSGFYLSRNDDGQLCVKRDTLHSRSGVHCQITRIRQLIETVE